MKQNRPPDVWLPPFEAQELNIRALGQIVDYWHPLAKTFDAWKYSRGNKAVVFVIDTAPEFKHEDMPTTGNRFGGTFTGETVDGHGHGHMCGSVIGAIDNALGVIGAAPDCLVVPVAGLTKEGNGFSDKLAAAIRHCADVDLKEYSDRIRIISMSWGGTGAIPPVEEALKYAVSKGCIPVAAAGNSYYQGQDNVNYPGKYDTLCITVASIGALWKPSTFSSGGATVDVAAFGEHLTMCNHQGTYSRGSGTSFATPMVAGLLANVVSYHYAEFRSAGAKALPLAEAFLEKYAKDLEAAGKDATTGAGAPVMEETYFKNKPSGEVPDPPKPEPPKPDPKPEPQPEPPTGFQELKFPLRCNLVWRDHTAPPTNIFSEPAGYTVQGLVTVQIAAKDIREDVIGMIGNHIDTVGFVYRSAAMYGAQDTQFYIKFPFKRAHKITSPSANLYTIAKFLGEQSQARLDKDLKEAKVKVVRIELDTCGFAQANVIFP